MTKFARALQKYGRDAFDWSELFVSWDQVFALETAEQMLIETYNTIVLGYNMVGGGHLGPKLCGADNGMFGKSHSEIVKTKLRSAAITRFGGKSYEELYGTERSTKLRQQRSEAFRKLDRTGVKNARFDPVVRTFIHDNGEEFIGTRLDFYSKYGLNKGQVSELISGKVRRAKGWFIP